MEIKFDFGTIKSKKTGVEYEGIYIYLTDKYKKFIILNDAELMLLKMKENEVVKPSDFPFEK